jgi:hypothetical protein
MKFSKGDILIPRDAQFPAGTLFVDGYDNCGRVLAHPLGGGFQLALKGDAEVRFRVADDDERARALFHRAKFSLMDSKDHFSGWTNGEDWNGWATPHFELAEAERLIAWLKNAKAGFDSERDAFVTMLPDGEEEVWFAQSVAITDGSRIKVYPIGADSWCWEEVEGRT